MSSYKNDSSYKNSLVREVFQELSIDKQRLPSSGLKDFGIPSFVAEWLLDKIVPGEGDLTQEEQDKVNRFVGQAFPRKDEKNEILYNLSQGKTQKIIGFMQVRVKLEKNGALSPDPVANIPVLGLSKCSIPNDLIEHNKMLLRQGLWGKVTLANSSEKPEVIDFDPFQCSNVDLKAYAECRSRFNIQQWRDLMFCSMGFNPAHPDYSQEAKTWVLARLLPIVEANYHVMELAPKGTGKSYVFENINSKVTLVSGGKVTPSQLFINGRTSEIGLIGRHDVVVLDEVQSLTFVQPDEIVGPLKNYLASGRYNRAGFADISSDCSLVMLANIELDEQMQPKNLDNLMVELPEFLAETALLDRFAGIIPGWNIPKFQYSMSASQIGLKMDFFGEALLALRKDTRFYSYAQKHTKLENAQVRDQNAILKSASGFLKILYPHLQLTLTDYERDCLKPAIELRQAIRNSLYYLDDEYRQLGREIYAEVIQ